jgi:hypothetical protein
VLESTRSLSSTQQTAAAIEIKTYQSGDLTVSSGILPAYQVEARHRRRTRLSSELTEKPTLPWVQTIHLPETLIGKALEPLEKGSGKILVLLSLQ